MKVFPIAEHVLETKYHGSGYAVAAVNDDVVVDLVYLRDGLEGFNDPSSEDGDNVQAILQDAICDDRLRPTIEQLRVQGAVTFGMCSCTEFVQL